MKIVEIVDDTIPRLHLFIMGKIVTKDEYVLRSLSKIKHKRWELFVVSRVVHALMLTDPDIEFVCQQLVRRPKGGRALTDLYFPQLGIFLEIDEPQHATEKHVLSDRQSTEDIVTAANLIEHRLIAYAEDGKSDRALLSVAEDTDEFIALIQQAKRDALAKGEFEPWDFEGKFDPQQHLERGYVSLATNAVFRYQHTALQCFGRDSDDVYQRGAWTLASDSSRAVWFPRLYETDTWDNELTPDGAKIIERKKDGKGGYDPNTYKEKWKSRIVCARYSDSLGAVLYRFVGEFAHDPSQSDEYTQVFKRIADRVPTIPALKS